MDQNVFTYIILVLYMANVINYALYHNVPLVLYWFGAILINAATLFMTK